MLVMCHKNNVDVHLLQVWRVTTNVGQYIKTPNPAEMQAGAN